MPHFPDPYTNPHLKPPNALKSLCDVLEMRAAEPMQEEIRIQTFRKAFGEVERAVVMEVGCGTGAVARSISRLPNVAKVTGIDPSPVFIERAKELGRGFPRLIFQEGLGTALPAEDASVPPPSFRSCSAPVCQRCPHSRRARAWYSAAVGCGYILDGADPRAR